MRLQLIVYRGRERLREAAKRAGGRGWETYAVPHFSIWEGRAGEGSGLRDCWVRWWGSVGGCEGKAKGQGVAKDLES